MTSSAFSNIKACVFDAYGTVFDVHSAVAQHESQLPLNVAERVSTLWRTKQLEYTWLRSLMERHADFWQVTGDALDYALDSFDIENPPLRQDLMDAYLELNSYPEVESTLQKLKTAGMQTAILSNGSPAMLEAAVRKAGLEDLIDRTLSIEAVQVYKPNPRVYQLAVDELGVAATRISFQSSNAWDAVGAAAFGFRVAWVNRFGQRRERLPATPDAELKTLDELPPLLGIAA